MPYPKFVAYAPGGGEAILSQHGEHISGGAKNLSYEEIAQERRARLLANPANGGTLETAKTFLEEAGWQVLWDGPAPNDSRLILRLPSDLKAWALINGGSEMIRRLIEAARERQEAETATTN